MKPGVQGVAGGQVDQADVRCSRPVPSAEHDAAEVVLADQSQAPRPNLSRRSTTTDDFPDALLPRSTINRASSVPTIAEATLLAAGDTAWGVLREQRSLQAVL
ncbi:hypothetical protein AMK11_15685 [Streptomyces sp. CB02414]|nr:hypothetical protein AMK11_15685 [Streptomyces sp. CB02414]